MSMTITQQLLEAISTCGESCYRIAKDSGVDYVSLCKFKRGAGKTTITLATADKLAAYFEMGLAKTSAENQNGNF